MNSRQVLRTQAAIIFDFDGTVALGHGPVLAYAKAIPEELLSNPAAFAEQVDAALADIDDMKSPYRDGYHAIAELAIAQGIDTQELSQAYSTSRGLLGTEQAPVQMPEKLPRTFSCHCPARLGGACYQRAEGWHRKAARRLESQWLCRPTIF